MNVIDLAPILINQPDRPSNSDAKMIKAVQELTGGKKGIYASIDASHTGYLNDNNRIYDTASAKKALTTWFDPYPTPFLINHDTGESWGNGDSNRGKVIGRNYAAKWLKVSGGMHKGVAMEGVVNIGTFFSDEDAKNEVRDARLLTVSSGMKMSNVVCSLCKNPVYSDGCEHVIGKDYGKEGVAAYYMYISKYKECSCTPMPANENAGVRAFEEFEDSIKDSWVNYTTKEFAKYAHKHGAKKNVIDRRAEELDSWLREKKSNFIVTDSQGNDYLNQSLRWNIYEVGPKPHHVDFEPDDDDSVNNTEDTMTEKEVLALFEDKMAANNKTVVDAVVAVLDKKYKVDNPDKTNVADSEALKKANDQVADFVKQVESLTVERDTAETKLDRAINVADKQSKQLSAVSDSYKNELIDSILLLKIVNKQNVTEDSIKEMKTRSLEYLNDMKKSLLGERTSVSDTLLNPTPKGKEQPTDSSKKPKVDDVAQDGSANILQLTNTTTQSDRQTKSTSGSIFDKSAKK